MLFFRKKQEEPVRVTELFTNEINILHHNSNWGTDTTIYWMENGVPKSERITGSVQTTRKKVWDLITELRTGFGWVKEAGKEIVEV